MCTNHLPRINVKDKGTWRRIVIIPFETTIEEYNDIKNYTDYLVNKAGGAILRWIIEGAKKAYNLNFSIEMPDIIKKNIDFYSTI